MALRLIQCPYCRHRFNIAGIAPGTKSYCPFCSSSLPRIPSLTRRWILQEQRLAPIALAAGLATFLAFGAYLLLRPEQIPKPELPVAVVEPDAEVPTRPTPEGKSGYVPPGERHGWVGQLRAVKQLLYGEFPEERFAIKDAYPFLVFVEEGRRFVKTDIIDDYAKHLHLLYRRFQKELASELGLKPIQQVLPVIILNSRESYDRYCRHTNGDTMPAQITGMYEYSRRRIVIYHDPWSLYEVILHEGVHQLVHHFQETYEPRNSHPVNSYWFQEGMGTYFEGFRRQDRRIILDPVGHRVRLPAVKEALRNDEFIPVGRLVKLSTEEFWNWFDGYPAGDEASRAKLAQLHYAESWALVYFLLNGDNGRYRRAFFDYFEKELQGSGTLENFETALSKRSKIDLPEFERAFIEYIQKLPLR